MRNAFCWLSIALVLCAFFPSPAWADDSPPAAKKVDGDAKLKAKEPVPRTLKEVEALFAKKPMVAVLAMVLKFVPLLIGIVLIILLYLRREKVRAGMLPARSPPRLTVPAAPGEALWLTGIAMFVVPFALLAMFGSKPPSLQQSFLFIAMGTLPVAFIVVFRRLRLRAAAPPGLLKSTGFGMGGFCIAIACFVPASLLWGALLYGLGVEPMVQPLIERAMEPKNPQEPMLIALFGVLVAPFTEEAIFRAMLYPVGKLALGNDRKAAIISGVATALLFGAIHGSLTAFVPLFVLALVLTWIFEKTNSLAAVVVAHGLNNLTSMLPLLLYPHL